MMAQTTINIRMDEELKKSFENVCDELGLNMSTAMTIFAKK
ncbi:MAG: type II toxin-antitoxin system RelB/DinJ family antitoxin [Acutalibacteraceae bacterium]